MTKQRKPIVAIDGPAGSGKSTVAQRAAHRAGLQFISSGAMYRAVALYAQQDSIEPSAHAQLVELADRLSFDFFTDNCGIVHTCVNGVDVTEALRSPAIGALASQIAVLPDVRARLVAKQQEYGLIGGVVMEGRDIQTVVFPDADIKIFLTASVEERAHRRWNELSERGNAPDLHTVLNEVRMRDRRDTERDVAPLCPAEDAICLDTDQRTIDDVVDMIVRLIETWEANPCLHGHCLVLAAGIAGG